MHETPGEYYRRMKRLAEEKRQLFGIETAKLNLNVVHRIYREVGVRIDQWTPKGRKLKACYFADGEPSVMVNKDLPREPKLFALIHELKHHFVDRDLILGGGIQCGAYNENELIEKGAEVFAAQFIYPDAEMLADLEKFGVPIQGCKPEDIVRFKRRCKAVVSYKFLVKRFERYERIEKGLCDNVKFTKLEEKIFGVPIYKRPSFIKNRKRRPR